MSLLKGVKVLDLSRLLPGSYATQYFADLGADVIKVEDTDKGDYSRDFGTNIKDMGSFYWTTNWRKKSISINLKSQEGLRIFYRLCENADVIFENFKPGTVKRLKVDWDTIRKINPKIVYCSLTGYGQSGELKDRAGHDINYLSLSGILHLMGPSPEDQPVIPGTQIADLGAGLSAALGIITGLYTRERTGKGIHIDASFYDTMCSWMMIPLIEYFASGNKPKRGSDMLNGGNICYNIYPTKDGKYMAVGALEEKFWIRTCEVLGLTDLKLHRNTLAVESNPYYMKLKNCFLTKTQDDWKKFFQHEDCCVTPVLDIQQVINDKHFVDRGILEDVHDEQHSFLPKVRSPLVFNNHYDKVIDLSDSLPPSLGENTKDLLMEYGYTSVEIEEWYSKGVIK